MENLISRFKEYLVAEFKNITPTKQASQYRKQLLNQLVDTANGYKNNGVEDEDLLYKMSIASLGDLRKTLLEFDKQSRRTAANIISAILILFGVSVAIYLIASFTSGAWNKTWLTFIYTIALVSVSGGVIAIIKAIPNTNRPMVRIAIIRLSLYIIVTTVFITLFLTVLMLANNFAYSWTILLYMVIAMLGVDLTACVFLKSKLTWLVLMAFIQSVLTLMYVALGAMHVIAWSPYWLMPVVALIVNIIMGVFLVCRKVKRHGKGEIDKKYYSDWDD